MSNPQEEMEITPKETQKEQELVKELVIGIWFRQGSAYEDKYQCKIIYGNADVEEEYDRHLCELNYPYRCPGVFKVRPRSIPTIVLCYGLDNTGNEEVRVQDLYIFTQDGWKYMKVLEERIPIE